MRNLFSFARTCLIALVSTLVLGLVTNASAQSCLGINACLLSPARSDAAQPISPNGCSVPPQFGALGQYWAGVFESACNQHDVDWGTFRADIASWFVQSNSRFYANMLAICQVRTDIPASQCMEAANIFAFAVSATDIGQDIFRRAQYFASSCACRQLPAAPSNLTAQVSAGPAGTQVSLQWAPAADATSYAVELVQPPLPPIETGSPLPMFTTTGVPAGQYRVQVRAVNPLGVSNPSNIADVVVGIGGPCVVPVAPAQPTSTFAGGVATVSWPIVAGATSYIVRAGSQPGGVSDIFNGNVGNTTAVSASGLPSEFRAFVRVHAVNACGVSAASPEVAVGAIATQ
jgi:hypothetical protein